jgi:histidine triad (HIT) family protein
LKRGEEKEMENCIFCRIVAGEIPCRKVFEDEQVLAFEDIQPMAPVHIIIIPKRHIATLMDADTEGMGDVAAMMSAARQIARAKEVDEKGFRVVINCNAEGGQVVFHLHMHLLGGRQLQGRLG